MDGAHVAAVVAVVVAVPFIARVVWFACLGERWLAEKPKGPSTRKRCAHGGTLGRCTGLRPARR